MTSHENVATELKKKALTVVVIGASGDLAKKKTFPALFALHCLNLLPSHANIIGYSRSPLSREDFEKRVSMNFKTGTDEQKADFLKRCSYQPGQYNSAEDFKKLGAACAEKEKSYENGDSNRVFYFAIPPSIFADVSKGLQGNADTKTGWNRFIVEKPFGKDTDSFEALNKELAAVFREEQLYRIDHYLGKEMVQNLMVLRFGNTLLEPLWNRHYVSNVQIVFKEPFGTMGRGGYFDSFGIVRDVMQNHLLQVFTLVAMEPPVSLNADDVRDEKVKVLKCVPPIERSNVILGQYGADPNGKEPSYLEDDTVPNDSVTPTFAAAVLFVNNVRWQGVPFILKCGKALNERKTEVRIQFKVPPVAHLFHQAAANELVMRVQPNEAVYLKMMAKEPGLNQNIHQTELDLSYMDRYSDANMPDAYSRLVYDVLRGDQSQFVRDDELREAWKIFTPLLHEIDNSSDKPILYDYGSRGPKEADELLSKHGFKRFAGYKWTPKDKK